MSVKSLKWNVDTQRRTGVRGRPPKVLDKYTHRGTERIIPEDEVKNPSDGFARQFGIEKLTAIRRLSSTLRKGETAEGLTLLRRTAAPGVIYTFSFRDGARTLFVTLKGKDVLCFGCDPNTAAQAASRTRRSFEPDVDLSTLTGAERMALVKQWAWKRQRHEAVEQQMNADMVFRAGSETTARYKAYAKAHGLRIKTEVVDVA